MLENILNMEGSLESNSPLIWGLILIEIGFPHQEVRMCLYHSGLLAQWSQL